MSLAYDNSIESGWSSFSDELWADLVKASTFKTLRFKELSALVEGEEDPWAAAKNVKVIRTPITVRSASDTPLRPPAGRKRVVLAIAGSGWGKSSFKRGSAGMGLVVCDIDDYLRHDAKAMELRARAARGEISWQEVMVYTHADTREALASAQPDVILNHSPARDSLPFLPDDFAVEEWWISPPPIDEVVVRVRSRASSGEEDRAELMARLNYAGLGRAKPTKRAVAQKSGTWTELWNRCLKEVLGSRGPEKGLTTDTIAAAVAVGGCYMERSSRVLSRSSELGTLGIFLRGRLVPSDLIDRRSIEADVMVMGQIRMDRGELSVCAYSLLCMDFPVQTVATSSTINMMLDAALVPLPAATRAPVDIFSKAARRRFYPLKSHPGASNKVNVYANEVYARAREFVPGLCLAITASTVHHDGFSDDQLSAMIMAAVALNPYNREPAVTATRMVRDPKGCKSLSQSLKSLGLNSHPLGALLCEGEALQGRGVVVQDPMEDAGYRTGGDVLEAKLHSVDELKLRGAIRAVIQRECPRDVEFEEVGAFWERRWEWCVNGAHSKLIERLHPGLVPDSPVLNRRQVHRRVFAERLVWEPITGWDGESYYGLSWKLECGKTRAIYSGDSLTYFAFEHLFKPVERAWKNKRVILDPGGIGTWKIGKRIRKMKRTGPVHVMLDYDDFNSRHRLNYMAMVVEELVDHVKYPPALKDKLIHSLYHGHILVGGKRIGDLAGTLMSGHRGTTFFNSVLNEAYIRVAYPELDSLKSLHVGDDVYISSPSYAEAGKILSSCSGIGLAMNPLKQSVGVYSAEFLRVSYGERCARGYVCRSIGTCVNGNWSSEVRLNAEEGLKSIIGHSWTLCNRAQNFSMGVLLVSSVKRLCKLSSKIARELLTGASGLDDGPARANGLSVSSLALRVDTEAEENDLALATEGLGDNATIDYLTYCATPLEQYVLGELGASVRETMRCASYKKTMISSFSEQLPSGPADVTVRRKVRAVRTTVPLESATRDEIRGGLLREFPLLQLVKNRLSGELLAQALMYVGSPVLYGAEALVYAWGQRSKALSIMGCMTYSDASALCSRCMSDLVYTDFPIYA